MNKQTKYRDEDIIAAASLSESSNLLTSVLGECGITADSEDFTEMRLILHSGLRKRVLFAIWGNLNEKVLEHFRSFYLSAMRADFNLDHETVLLKFTLLYPDLVSAVHESIQEYFDGFVKNYRRIFR